MTKQKIRDIHDRIYQFVLRVLKLIKKVPKTPENTVIIYQITKSATSMGANDREADGVTTKNDFVHKYSIVRKEAKETDYWLCLIRDTNNTFYEEATELIEECLEITKIVSSIIYKTQTNISAKK